MTSKSSAGKIITFYSYKGGTGRSMMMANVAWILASGGKQVLAIDWDLEAPGLHRYFYPFLTDKDLTNSDGVINFVTDYKIKVMTPPTEGTSVPDDWYVEYADIMDYASTLKWEFDGGGRLDFVPPGRQDESYSRLINSFSWPDFYERLGGKRLLDETKKKMRENYDYILIDSRTGVSDTSGICTLHMPDTLVICFTLNYQSINGASTVARTALEERSKLDAFEKQQQGDGYDSGASGGIKFNIFPVPTRLEKAEKEKLQLLSDYARNMFLQFPLTIYEGTKEQYWGDAYVDYEPYYAYEELLASFGEKERKITSLLSAAERIASYITDGEVKQLATLPQPRRNEILDAFRGQKAKPMLADVLTQDAGKVFSTLSNEQQDIARRVFLRLIRVARPEEVDRRNSRQKANIKDFIPAATQVIEILCNAQILEITQEDSTNEAFVQITQESIIQDWKLLQNWIEEDRNFLNWRQELWLLVEQWKRDRYDERLLLQGDQLRRANRYLNNYNVGLDFTPTDLDFIRYSNLSEKEKQSLQTSGGNIRVFVIMPLGINEVQSATSAIGNSPWTPAINANFDDIYELLIKPILIKANCVPFRADKEPGGGDIRTDMYFELVTADVILADISILDPNVFYELGVRHGVAPHGVFMIHGGWAKRPFDIAPDRTFAYDGKLFAAKKEERDGAWQEKLEAEVKKLSTVLRGAMEVDEQTIGSPVYKELVGLKPVDWSNIQTARSRYFGEVFVEWKTRVEVAKANGWPGDILTLADDAPTRFHCGKLLWEAADALVSMHRFEAARSTLEELLTLDPKNQKAQTQLGLVLGRLGKINEAKVHMTRVADQYSQDTEAQGILGRIYKDLWQLEWIEAETLEERQQQAINSSSYIISAIRSYYLATSKYFDYYNGINVVSCVKLLEHLENLTGSNPVDYGINDLENFVSVVRFAAQNAVDQFFEQDVIWGWAALGEIELVAGDPIKAKDNYFKAANTPFTSYFQISSMLEQIYLFESLGFRPEAVAEVKKVLEQRRNVLEKKIGDRIKSEPRFKKVVIFSGHMIDKPGRPEERFPPHKEDAVRERIAKQLDAYGIGKGDLAICGGARGGDILFAELCADRGAEVWLFLALPENEFLEESVRLPDSDWEQRFFSLQERENVKVSLQIERLKSPPKGTSVFARNNLWVINTALVEANNPRNLYAILVWDEKPTGDGLGGTSDFASRVRRLGGRLAPVINPLSSNENTIIRRSKSMSVLDKMNKKGPRKLLALDGGGIRGVMTLEVLAKIEGELQKKFGRDNDFVLADYFDYIAGTSTGAIIGTCLSLGMRVADIRDFYVDSGPAMFNKTNLIRRYLFNKFHDQELAKKLRDVIEERTGEPEAKLGSDKIRTYLMLVLRNASTDSPWPISNNPEAKYNRRDRPVSNLDMPLWQLVRASTAAPTYFPPEIITIRDSKLIDHDFVFVDGGVTMYNNPAFHLFLMATATPYNLEWPTGEDKMLLVSIGTGIAAEANENLSPGEMNIVYNASSLPSAFMFAASNEQDLLCRMFGKCLNGDMIDRELEDMKGDPGRGVVNPKLFTYMRYNADLSKKGLAALGLSHIEPRSVQQLDSVDHIKELQEVGRAVAKQVDISHFEGFPL